MKKKSKEEFVKDAQNVHGDKYEYPGEYLGTHSKINILCAAHGIFSQICGEHIRGKGCHQCSVDSQRSNKERFIEQARELHGNKYEYLGEYINTDTNMKMCCLKHGIFYQTPYKHVRLKRGCQQCGIEKSADSKRLDKKMFAKRARKIHGDRYDYPADYITGHTKIDIICSKHGVFSQTPNSHIHGNGCPFCSSNVSRLEIEWLNHLGIELRQHKIKIKSKNETTLKVDGYDPATNTVYEFHGDYWHGNPNIYTDFFAWNSRAKCQMFHLYKKTLNRENLIKKAGYNLVVIWESEWKVLKTNASVINIYSEVLS